MTSWLEARGNFSWFAIVLIVCVPVVAEFWRKMRRDQLEVCLKQDMVARGMSADEIERVLQARSSKQDR